ncbi:MAG: GNAT family N-acetyltransferase [Candidatus Dormibacteria bacterium]
MTEVRQIRAEELEESIEVNATAFGDTRNAWWDEWVHRLIRPEMVLGAFEDGRIVGTAAALPATVNIPGGRCQVSAITGVGVLPTHRRRGLLRALMTEQLGRDRALGRPLAILWASEGGIYGRFGFGIAARRLKLAFETPEMKFIETSSPGSVRLVDREEALRLMPQIYQRALRDRPGPFTRDPTAWEALIDEKNPELPSAEAHHFFAIHGADPDGYAIYRVRRGGWSGSFGPRSTAIVVEMVGDGPGPTLDLWRFLADLDLVHAVEARQRPIDEPLLWMASDPQRIEVRAQVGIWAGILDVPGALRQRRYRQDGRLVLEVRDDFLPDRGGRFDLSVRAGEATCEASTESPDIRLGLAELSSGYLGQSCYRELARSGRLEELTSDAALLLDRLLGWDPPPWCPEDF